MVKFPFSLPSLCLYPIISITFFLSETHVLAQAIVQDGTLPNNSIVNQAGNNYTIEGGTTVGGNLFHSFSQFSVPLGDIANFNNAAAIANIISRVTGNSISDIQGLISANGTANLFLINPNGIIFGPNAALDIGGSFVASTADSIEFVGGGLFSARNPGPTGTLLTMTAPLGLQMGPNPGEIRVQGFGNNLATDPDNFEIVKLPSPPFAPVTPLAVSPGETLALVGGNIVFDGGNIEAAQGRIELGAFSNGRVDFANQNGQIQLTPATGDIGYNNIDMGGASSVNVSGNIGGSVQVQGRNLSLTGGSVILANTTGGGTGGELKVTTTESIRVSGIGDKPPLVPPFFFAQDVFSGLFANVSSTSTPSAQGGHIKLNTGRLIVSDGGQIGANTFGAGQAGRLTVNAQDIQLSGESFLQLAELPVQSGLFAAVATNASGRGGRLTVNTNTLQMSDGANINVGTFGMGNGGAAIINASTIDLTGTSATTSLPTGIFGNVESGATGNGSNLLVNTHTLTLSDGANISVNTFSSGNAGNATINASNIQLTGFSASTGQPTGIFGNVEPQATGNGSNLLVNTDNLTLKDGARISVNTFSDGNAGNANINASNIELTGFSASTGQPTGIFGNVEPQATGNGGNLSVNTGNLTLKDGARISVNTFSNGNAGNATINASNIDLTGTSAITGLPTGIFGNVEPQATGNGGNLSVNTGNLTLRDGARISVNTFSDGNGGNLLVNTGNLTLKDGARINVNTFSNSNAGNATINASNIKLSGNDRNGNATGVFSNVTTDATGNGGRLQFNTGSLVITNGAQIGSLTLGSGNGGSIDIQADRIDIQGASNFSPSAIVAEVGSVDNMDNEITGNGGQININTNVLSLRDGGIINTNTTGLGQAGNITVNAQTMQVVGGVSQTASGLFSAVRENAQGNGGNIAIKTQHLSVEQGGQIVVSTAGFGNGGNLDIVAQTIELSGETPLGASGLFANAINSTGNGGSIEVKTDNLGIYNGATINVGNFASRNTNIAPGQGEPGNINIEANSIVLDTGGTITADTLVGSNGNIVINTNGLTLGNNSLISTNAEGTGSAGNIRVQANSEKPNINLTQSRITASGEQGNLSIEAKKLSLNNSLINAEGNQGNIDVNTNSTRLSNNSAISTNAQGNGSGGTITVNTNHLELEENSRISSNAQGDGSGGTITVNTNNLNIRENSRISANAEGSGSAGNVTIEGRSQRPNINLNRGSITATGEQGNLSIQADNLTLDNSSLINTEGNQGNIELSSQRTRLSNSSGISSNAQGNDSGGNIALETNELTLETFSNISANAEGSGSAGNVTITSLDRPLDINLSQSKITATGNQGNIRITSENLQLDRTSGISANAEGNGDGGNVTLINNNDLTLQESSFISTDAQGVGRGGNIELVTGSLDILSNSEITANASATSGGNINLQVTSPQTFTQNSGTISATGGQGNITITSPLVILRNGSLISTNGLGTEPGGNINIKTDFLLSFPTENNDITANAQQSQGGRVIIDALGVFGIEFRDFLTPLSDITVTSELGPAFSGEVLIRVPEGDPTSGFNRLPDDTIDPRDLIVIACAADAGNVFIRTGKGGIPDNPEQPLRWRNIWEDLRDLMEGDDQETNSSSRRSDGERNLHGCTE